MCAKVTLATQANRPRDLVSDCDGMAYSDGFRWQARCTTAFPVIARNHAAGFTLIETLVVVAIISILAAVAVPMIAGAMRLYTLNTSAQTVGAAIRSARYSAVSKNRTVRVRFNCPAANQFRIVEVVGSNAIDADADRCSETAYPYPDPDASAGPSIDGPVVMLPADAQFETVQDIEINTAGRATPLAGCPTCVAAAPPATVAVGNGDDTRTITITASGQVLLP